MSEGTSRDTGTGASVEKCRGSASEWSSLRTLESRCSVQTLAPR